MRTAIRRYYRGHNLVTMRDVQAAQSRTYHFDPQGTTQCLTDSTGAVTDRFAADAWGVEVKRSGSSINRQWYVGNGGYYYQRETDVQYVRRRWLASPRGLWLSTDPLMTLASYSPYVYCNNRPTYNLDLSGLQSVTAGEASHWRGSGSTSVLNLSNCPDPCNRDDHGTPVEPPPYPACPNQQQYRRIQNICHSDYVNNNRPPWGLRQAYTECCYKQRCAKRCTREEIDQAADSQGNHLCVLYTGCVVVIKLPPDMVNNNWNWLPAAFQWCLWQHERRRVQLCKCKQTAAGQEPTLVTPSETDRMLQCVGSVLRGCGLNRGYCAPRQPVHTFDPKRCTW